jgi:transcriptional regulator with XRE-family HTH domain
MEKLQRLGAYLRGLREQHSLSAAQCAAALGVGEASIYRIEAGRIDTRVSLLLGYAALVGASGDYLVGLFAQPEEVAA